MDKKGAIIQYSFVGQNQPERASETSSAPLWFSKGLLVVIPDEDWPDQYSKSDIAFSGHDVKTHSGWREKKGEEFSKDPELITRGSLFAVEVYDPVSSIAMPINAQRYLSGDFDGDHVFLMDKGYPKVSKMIKEDYEQRQEDASRAEKPSKTYTSAFDEDNGYQFGRSQQIGATRKHVLEIFSGLKNAFLALPENKKEEVASNILVVLKDKKWEKIRSMKDISLLFSLQDNLSEKPTTKSSQLLHFFSLAIKAGTDAYKATTDIHFFSDCMPIVQSHFSKNHVKTQIPYTKHLARLMSKKTLDSDSIIQNLELNLTLSAQVMKIGVQTLKKTSHLDPIKTKMHRQC